MLYMPGALRAAQTSALSAPAANQQQDAPREEEPEGAGGENGAGGVVKNQEDLGQ